MQNYRQKERQEATHRQELMNLMQNIVNCGEFKSKADKIIAFACLYVRIAENENDISKISRYAGAHINEANDGYAQYRKCLKINSRIHVFLDEEENYIFNQQTGELSSLWKESVQERALALEAIAPPGFFPHKEAVYLDKHYHDSGVNLINTRKKAAYQTKKQMPKCYQAINVLQAQRYKLSTTMQNLKNLPIALETTKNYAYLAQLLGSLDAFSGDFSFQYTLDYRARAYARSLIAQPQGDSFAKASIEFAESKPLGDDGRLALLVHYAGVSGHDKTSITERIRWANEEGQHKAFLMAKALGDWEIIQTLVEDHKHSFQEYTAAIEVWELYKYEELGGDHKEFKSRLVCHQDATNSGFQFGAALTGDIDTAEKVNLLSSWVMDKPEDLYNEMALNLNNLLREKQETWMTDLPIIDRKFCKKPIMVTGYGAGLEAVMKDIQEDYPTHFLNNQDPNTPTILSELTEKLKPFIEEALILTASSMKATTKVMHGHAEEILAAGAEQITWTTPDGFKVIQEKRDRSGRRIELANQQVVLEKLEPGKKDPLDQEGMTKSLPPNFIHSMDAQMLRTAAILADVQNVAFCPIHDSFGTHAGTFYKLNLCLKHAFIKTMDYPWYENFCEENNVTPKDIKIGNYDTQECLGSTYMFS